MNDSSRRQLRDVTGQGNRPVPLEIDGVRYFSAVDIHRELGVARQTLWRWRKSGKIPRGRRYRDHRILFTAPEVDAIRYYANRLEPEGPIEVNQAKIGNPRSPKRKRHGKP